MYAVLCIRSFENDKGLELVQSLNTGSFQVRFYAYDYLVGKAKLNRLDQDALAHLKNFYSNSPGEDFKKEIARKIAQYHLINGNMAEYKSWNSKVDDVGSDMTDRDREAEIEANLDYDPLPELMEVRLLFEGGYFDNAETALKNIAKGKIATEPYNLAYTYWNGRILQETGRSQEAISAYRQLIDLANADFFFAADAAYQVGFIYEQDKQYSSAVKYYQTALDLNDSDWENFIEIKANRGVERVEGK
jgi:tetratricopeptide (TPR) repeat protein